MVAADEHHLLRARLGADRVVEPPNALPQAAERLDAAGPVRDHEFKVTVDRLDLDATSFRNIRERCAGDPDRMSARILEIVAARGKMHNPETGSGGVLLGTVSAVGAALEDPPPVGERIVPLPSLTLTPLRLEAVVGLEPASAQIAVRGTAYVCAAAPWAMLPGDIPTELAVEILDVYAAASHTRTLARSGGTVCVLGASHAGRLACAAARDAAPGATVVAVDISPTAIDALTGSGLCDIGVVCDLRDPLATVAAVRDRGAGPADLTVAVTDAPGCEAAAILLTAELGTVVFFSTAGSFTTAALTADGMSRDIRMFVGSGYAPDRGTYALDLVRRSGSLRRAMGIRE